MKRAIYAVADGLNGQLKTVLKAATMSSSPSIMSTGFKSGRSWVLPACFNLRVEVAIFMRYDLGDHNSQLRPGLVEDMQARMNR